MYGGQRALLLARLASEGLGDVSAQSVDSAQGQESEFVILSLVRSNERGIVGHTAKPNRLNVALTRARRGLVVIGDFQTLSKGSPLLHRLYERGRGLNAIVTSLTATTHHDDRIQSTDTSDPTPRIGQLEGAVTASALPMQISPPLTSASLQTGTTMAKLQREDNHDGARLLKRLAWVPGHPVLPLVELFVQQASWAHRLAGELARINPADLLELLESPLAINLHRWLSRTAHTLRLSRTDSGQPAVSKPLDVTQLSSSRPVFAAQLAATRVCLQKMGVTTPTTSLETFIYCAV